MSPRKFLLIAIVIGAFLMAFIPLQRCATAAATEKSKALEGIKINDTEYAYEVNSPERTITLGTKLAEISGLTMALDGIGLLAVQDEKGHVYQVDPLTGNIVADTKFGGSDDYEGLELFNGEMFVVNSKGNLDVWKLGQSTDEKRTANTFLNSDYDVEGLGALPSKNILLVACKSAKSKKDRNRKIFALDPESLKLDSIPFIAIDYKEVSRQLGRPEVSPIFSPSGIAVHPVSGHIYVISSPAKAMIVYSEEGKLLDVVELSSSIHPQPEGITFNPDGILYISNEAHGGFAKIHIFPPS
ncbi:MAG: SdiA-regulated domain-containing protein [Saprospiraceae bacterium]|nr:SdiA-regulated domain-containing protein [Saprospiraceae bacterium]